MITLLENLSSSAIVNYVIQLNAALLLAGCDHNHFNKALEMCNYYNCLAGEIEFFIYELNIKKSITDCVSHDLLAIVYKIKHLLSLEPQLLIAEYKNILGLCNGKEDVLYLEQQQYTSDLQREFVPNCYLLPNKVRIYGCAHLTH